SRSLATPAQAARERESGGLHRADLTAAGSLVGTLRYMSPEQAAGETVTVATDLYSFGVLLQELFTGEIPYGDLDFGTLLERVQEGRTGPLGDLDPELRRLLEQLLARDPGARPGAGDVASALRRIVDRPKRRRRRRWLAAASLAMVLALGATGWAAHRAARPPALMTDGGRVLLMPFVNETGDPSKSWVEHGLARMVAETLGGVDRLDLVGPSVLQRTLDQQRLTVEALTDDDIDRLTRAFGADVAIVTSAEARGERYALAYTAHRPGTKHREHRVQADDLAVAAGVLGQRLAQRLAPGSLVVELQDQFSTDPFLNRLYAMGVERLRGAGTAACPYFRVCIDREPGFARARGMLAECLSQTGAYPEAEALWLEVIEQARRQGDPHLEAAALLDLGNLKTNLSRLDEAEADLERALDLFRQQGDRIYEAETLVSVSGLRASRGDWPGAQGLAERAVAIQEETGDRIGLARSLHTLGVTHSEQWNLEAAVDTFERAVEIERELGIPYMLATTLNSLGNTLPYLERFEEAEVTLLEALTLARSVGNPSLEGMVISNLGNILLATERPAEAAERFAEALVIFEELGLTPRIAYSAINLAIALAKTERYDEGRPHLATARDFLPPGDVVLVFAEGLYAFGDGDPRRAVELLERAKGLAGEDGWGESDEVLLLRYRAAAAGG
ncbi:MAG: tetratricopeptide repeat protein, partial [Acidobacteriota bacterium]